MSLSPGTRIGAYEITAPLGAGGMGEVYRAKDSKLKREVALKVLPAEVAGDRERMARFQREAEVLASLNHPNIAQIYGIEESPGGGPSDPPINALVMELVEGEDLAERLTRGPIPLDEALPIAKQIADAFEAAHEQGIIHRDLKPANVKVRPDGTVKVLDFGLAKALDRSEGDGFSRRQAEAEASALQTITTPAMTMRGAILGTAAYMAPEQAKGKAVDKRADIWAFGVVLFEMLAGKKAFAGEDITDTLTAVMRDSPDWSALPAETPAAIRTLLRRSIEKDPRKRVPHVAVARLEIEDAMLATGELVGAATGAPPAPRRASWTLTLGVGAAMALAATAFTLLVTRPSPATSGDAPTIRFTISLPTGITAVGSPAASPDGRFVAIDARDGAGKVQVWLRALDGDAFAPVPGTTDGVFPFWSPDSTELGFFVNRRLMRTAVQGGTPRAVANTEPILSTLLPMGTPATWGADGSILFGADDGIYRVAASGGTIARVTEDVVDGDGSKVSGYSGPQWMPNGIGFLYTTRTGARAERALRYRPASGRESVLLSAPRGRAQHTIQGLLVGRSTGPDTTLSLYPFDPASGTLGETGTVLPAVASLNFSASQSGVLVYRSDNFGGSHLFEWIDSQGRPTGDSFEVSGPGAFNVSRDGSLLAYTENGAVMLRDIARGVATRLVPQGTEPLLSPDGQRVTYTVQGPNQRIMVQPSAGGAAEVVYEGKLPTFAEDWSSDGRFLSGQESGRRGLIIPLDKKQPPTVYADLPTGASLDESRFSPDGKWLTYNAADSGSHEVYLVPLPPTGERWQLSVAGGAQGRWRRDGRAVYYLAPSGDLMTVELQATPGSRPRIGRPQKLIATGLEMTHAMDQYAVNGDGSRFLLRRPQSTAGADELHVIVNWPGLLRAKP